jgi:hypothetical protein
MSVQIIVSSFLISDLNKRVIIVTDFKEILLHFCFTWILLLVSFNEISSIKTTEYSIFRGVFQERYELIIQTVIIFIRYFQSLLGMFVLLNFVLTHEDENASVLDQTKDFSALVILFEIDVIVLGPLVNNFFNNRDF